MLNEPSEYSLDEQSEQAGPKCITGFYSSVCMASARATGGADLDVIPQLVW